MKISFWKQSLPKAEQIAQNVEKEVGKQVEDTLVKLAEQWKIEDKLIHAGAALRLAKRLKQELIKD